MAHNDKLPCALYIPPALFSGGFTRDERDILAEAWALSQKGTKSVTASQQHYAERHQLSTRTIRRVFSSLRKKGHFSGSKRTYFVRIEPATASCSGNGEQANVSATNRPHSPVAKKRTGQIVHANRPNATIEQANVSGAYKEEVRKKETTKETKLLMPSESAKQAAQDELFEKPKRVAKIDPLKTALESVCGLTPLIGTEGYPGSRVGKALRILRSLKPEPAPAELEAFGVWAADQTFTYKRRFPTVEHVSGHLHEFRQDGGKPRQQSTSGYRPAPLPPRPKERTAEEAEALLADFNERMGGTDGR